MTFHYNFLSIILLVSGIGTLTLALVFFKRLVGSVKSFSSVMFCIAIWAIAYGFELASDRLDQILFILKIEYIGISFLPAAWIFFIIQFIGKDDWLTRRNRFFIFLIPSVTFLLSWTNSLHHFFYSDYSLSANSSVPLLIIEPGPWYYMHTVYFYCMLSWGAYLLVNKFRKADTIFRKQNRLILIGAFVPWGVNFLYLLGLRPYEYLDLTPYALIITSGIITLGILRFRLFDIVPMARSKVIDGMEDGVLVLDHSSRIIDINIAMKKFLSAYTKDYIGRRMSDLFTEGKELLGMISDSKQGKLDVRLKSGNNDYRFFEVAVTSVHEEEMTYNGTLMIFRDITERKLTEKKLQERTDELAELNQLKDRIFSIISHDLRSPLAGLITLLNASQEGDISEQEFKSYLQLMSKNVNNTSTLLENLLFWSKSQLSGETIKFETFDLKAVIRREMYFFERKAAEKSVRMEDHVRDNSLVYADMNMISLVIRNILSNAIKFCDYKDEIVVDAEIRNDYTTISISDTGIGMDRNRIDHIFDAGVSTLGTHKEKGTGLGLKLCKEFVEKNKGQIWVESDEGHGSIFYIKLQTGLPETVGKKMTSEYAKQESEAT